MSDCVKCVVLNKIVMYRTVEYCIVKYRVLYSIAENRAEKFSASRHSRDQSSTVRLDVISNSVVCDVLRCPGLCCDVHSIAISVLYSVFSPNVK